MSKTTNHNTRWANGIFTIYNIYSMTLMFLSGVWLLSSCLIIEYIGSNVAIIRPWANHKNVYHKKRKMRNSCKCVDVLSAHQDGWCRDRIHLQHYDSMALHNLPKTLEEDIYSGWHHIHSILYTSHSTRVLDSSCTGTCNLTSKIQYHREYKLTIHYVYQMTVRDILILNNNIENSFKDSL